MGSAEPWEGLLEVGPKETREAIFPSPVRALGLALRAGSLVRGWSGTRERLKRASGSVAGSQLRMVEGYQYEA